MRVSLLRSVWAFFLLPLFLLIACDGDDDPTAPAAVATGAITVVAGDRHGELAPGAAVLHQDATGALLAEKTADASGRVEFEIRAGDMVTVRTPPSEFESQRMVTIVGVQPDDALDLRRHASGVGTTTHTVVVNGTIPDPQDLVIFGTPCSNGGGRVTLPFTTNLRDTCGSDSGRFHFRIHTRLGGEKQAFASVTDLVLDTDGTTDVDLPATWRTDWQDVEFVVPDPGFAFDSASLRPLPERDGSGYDNLETWNYEGPASLQGHVLRMIPGFAETLRLEMSFDDEDRQLVADVRVPVDETTTRLAPNPPTPSIEFRTPEFSDPRRPRVRWSVDRDGVAGDYLMVDFYWQDGDDSYVWKFFLPPSASSLRIPELPADFFADVPAGLDTISGLTLYAEFVEDDFLDGFDAARERAPFRTDVFRSARRPGQRITSSTWMAAPGLDGFARFRAGEEDGVVD